MVTAANPPEVLNLPPGFDDLTAEEYRILTDMEIDNSTEKPSERAVPARAPGHLLLCSPHLPSSQHMHLLVTDSGLVVEIDMLHGDITGIVVLF